MTDAIKPLRGLIGAPVTPFTEHDEVDADLLQRQVDFFVRHGADSLAIMMHVGENLKLGADERRRVAEISVEAAAGRVPTYIHVSEGGTGLAVSAAQHAESIGADGVIVLPPYFWQPPSEVVVAHLRAVADSITGGVVIYNNPGRLGVTISTSMLKQILETCPNVVGMKDASFNMLYFTEACRAAEQVRPDFGLFTGVDGALLPASAAGASGTFTTRPVIAPRLTRNLVDLCLAGDYVAARPVQHQAASLFRSLRDLHPGPDGTMMKVAAEIMGRPCGVPRDPAQPITPEQRAQLASHLDELGIIESEPHGWS